MRNLWDDNVGFGLPVSRAAGDEDVTYDQAIIESEESVEDLGKSKAEPFDWDLHLYDLPDEPQLEDPVPGGRRGGERPDGGG